MTVLDDRTGATLGSLEKLAARDARDVTKHTGLSGVIDPSLRVALDCFDHVDLSGIGAILPSFSALGLVSTKSTGAEVEVNDDLVEGLETNPPQTGPIHTRHRSAGPWHGGGHVGNEQVPVVPDHISAFGWDVDEDPNAEPEKTTLGRHDVDIPISVGADLNVSPDLWAARNAFVHGSGAVFELLAFSGVQRSISLALDLVLPGSWASNTLLRPEDGRNADVVFALASDAGSLGRAGDVRSRARQATPALGDGNHEEQPEVELPGDADVVTTVRALVDALGLPLRDVLKAAGIRRSSFHSWDKPGKPRPRTSSVGRLWALAQAVEDLADSVSVPLGRWLLAAPSRRRLLLDGSFDELVELAMSAAHPRELRPSLGPSTGSAVRPDDGSPLLTPLERPRKGVGSQVVTRRGRGTSS